jgi:predicted acylesterase/phospholipase RssA
MKPKNLVIGPGGMSFFVFLGKVSQIDMSDVKAISGCSSGAILALLWVVLNGDIPEMLDFSLRIPIKNLMKPNIRNFLLNFGLVPLERVQKILKTIFLKSFGVEDMTFGQLYKARPIDLYMTAFCIDLCDTTYFSWKTHPDLSIIQVLSASIAVPLLFSSVTIGQWRYVDGAMHEEAPGMPFIGEPSENTLAIQSSMAPPRPTKNLATYESLQFGSQTASQMPLPIVSIRHI